MAQNVKINNVIYSAVPSVQIPLAEGSGNATFYDTAAADVQAQHIVAGKTAFGASGPIEGTLSTVSVTQDQSTKILSIT